MFGTGYIFSAEFFTGWVVVGILWLFISCTMVVFLPVFESRRTIVRTAGAMWKDLTGLGKRQPDVVEGESIPASGTNTPPVLAEKDGEKEVR
jgi:hypothetical protein